MNILNRLNQGFLYVTVFLTGAFVMAIELLAARAAAPYLGSSIITWTSIIGIMLGCLSFGYLAGGKLADSNRYSNLLSSVLWFAGLYLLISTYIKAYVYTNYIAQDINSLKYSVISSTLILFGPPSFLLGMVTPIIVKQVVNNLKTSASTIGRLYALSTLGSIVGTFVTGFYLIALFGTTKLLFAISICLITLGALHSMSKYVIVTALTVTFLSNSILSEYSENYTKQNFIDLDTAYNRVWIYDQGNHDKNEAQRIMMLNRQLASIISLNPPYLSNSLPNHYYNLITYFREQMPRIAIIGGGAYTYPKEVSRIFPNTKIDVIEIDADLVKLATQYFYYQPTQNTTIYHEDARTFVKHTHNTYQGIIIDAFDSNFYPPFHLTTKEFITEIYNILDDDGVVCVNIVSAISGELSQFFQYQYHTYQSVFPKIYAFKISDKRDNQLQNIILYAFKNKDFDIQPFLSHPETKDRFSTVITDIPKKPTYLLTDDFAPVETFFSSAW